MHYKGLARCAFSSVLREIPKYLVADTMSVDLSFLQVCALSVEDAKSNGHAHLPEIVIKGIMFT